MPERRRTAASALLGPCGVTQLAGPMLDFADDTRAFAPSFREQDLQRCAPSRCYRSAMPSKVKDVSDGQTATSD